MAIALSRCVKRGAASFSSSSVVSLANHRSSFASSPLPPPPTQWVKRASCADDLRTLCSPTAQPQNRSLLYGMSPGSCTGTDPSHLTMVDEDVVNFQLVRGPSAYIGTGWSGCGKIFERPSQFDYDFGNPLGYCSETSAGSGVFTREFTHATVQMACDTFTPTITWK